jgi:predicted MFS family arabinose efflux permease
MAMLTVSDAAATLHTWEFLVVAVGLGVADAFFWPASGSIVSSLVSSTQLDRANAVTAVGEQVGGEVTSEILDR